MGRGLKLLSIRCPEVRNYIEWRTTPCILSVSDRFGERVIRTCSPSVVAKVPSLALLTLPPL
jgi:hypothetical protein